MKEKNSETQFISSPKNIELKSNKNYSVVASLSLSRSSIPSSVVHRATVATHLLEKRVWWQRIGSLIRHRRSYMRTLPLVHPITLLWVCVVVAISAAMLRWIIAKEALTTLIRGLHWWV